MINFFVAMTDAQSRRWEKTRAGGQSKYVWKKTLLYGGVVPALILWAFFRWTTFGMLVFWLAIFSLPFDYLIARASWSYQEYRYANRVRT